MNPFRNLKSKIQEELLWKTTHNPRPFPPHPKSIRGQDPFPQDDFPSPPPPTTYCGCMQQPEARIVAAASTLPPTLFCRSLSRCYVINVAKRRRRRSKPWCVNPLCAPAKDWRGAQRAINKINFPVLLSFSLSRSYFRYSSRERSNSIEEPCRVEWSCPGPGMHEFNKAQKDSGTSLRCNKASEQQKTSGRKPICK
ncbi:hypothetical protein AVEN_203445-1 [Araneus ventricosus]|uniref:Uncharacterized protein n=1 Tax=Araneus ventricosus TaxID=182803 RepID=A0A4Y2BI88_ARAVE|nr:hypothetical protein AVEN_203445-1 [Araneus ventricosus]